MDLKQIELTGFRNFNKREFDFGKTNIIVGPNAVGKTNILEAIYLLSTGKSFKAKVEEEMVKEDKDIARVKGKVEVSMDREDGKELDSRYRSLVYDTVDLEIVLTRGLIDIGAERPEKVSRKKMMVGGLSKRLIDFAGRLRAVVFAPKDLDLVTESPSIRRKFLDAALCLTDREYRRCLLSYEKGLRQRNRLLWQMRENPALRNSGNLLFWDKLLIKNGDYIAKKRREFIEFANETVGVAGEVFKAVYDNSVISESRLKQYEREEIASATTLVGPHRDDFAFQIQKDSPKPRDLSSFGSRGEQRMGVLWIKLAEIAYIEHVTSAKPILLLDDIFSELDHKHRDIVMKITGEQQTMITTADPHFVEEFEDVNVIKVAGN